MPPKAKVLVFGGSAAREKLAAAPPRYAKKSVRSELSSDELAFAARIAHTDKKRRQTGVLFLKKWLQCSSANLERKDFERLWTSVFYAFWLCDKYRAQLKLAVDLSVLPRSVRAEAYSDFLKSFYVVLRLKWRNLDRHRVDKFMLLHRVFLSECLDHLRRDKWSSESISKLVDVWTDRSGGFLQIERTSADAREPSGIALHFISVAVPELLRVLRAPQIDQSSIIESISVVDGMLPADTADLVGPWSNPHVDEEEKAEIREKFSRTSFLHPRPAKRVKITNGDLKDVNDDGDHDDDDDHDDGDGDDGQNNGNVAQKEILVVNSEVPLASALLFIEPLVQYASFGANMDLCAAIHEKIFRTLTTDEFIRLEDLAVRLFEAAASLQISRRHRKLFNTTLEQLDSDLASEGRKADYLPALGKALAAAEDGSLLASGC